MNIEYRKIDELIPYERNAKIHDDTQINNVAQSIRKNGWRGNPVLVNKNNVIIAGHCRVLAAKKLGWKEVPCEDCSDMNDEQIKEYRYLDNKLNESPWDFDILNVDIPNMSFDGFDLDWGLTINESITEACDDNFDVEEALSECIDNPITQTNDIWLLGKHRLICADSTQSSNIQKLMNGREADLCVTDPPYNVNYEGKAGTVTNDNMTDSAFFDFLLSAFTNIYSSLKAGASIYIFHSDTEGFNFRRAFFESGFRLSEVCIWKKQSFVMGRHDYHWQHEPILYGWKPGAAHAWYSDRAQSTIWEFNRPTKSDEHPTMKPIPLCAYPVQNSSKNNEIVLDPFAGSGSTLIACEQTERICYCAELSPLLCDTIVNRYIKSFGENEVFLLRKNNKTSYKEFAQGIE